jgi:hypothetical protein
LAAPVLSRLLARVTGSIETPVVAADLEAGPGSVLVDGFPQVSDVRLRAHAEDGWVELREAERVVPGSEPHRDRQGPISVITQQPAHATDGPHRVARPRNQHHAARAQSMVDPASLEEVTGTIDATA